MNQFDSTNRNGKGNYRSVTEFHSIQHFTPIVAFGCEYKILTL